MEEIVDDFKRQLLETEIAKENISEYEKERNYMAKDRKEKEKELENMMAEGENNMEAANELEQAMTEGNELEQAMSEEASIEEILNTEEPETSAEGVQDFLNSDEEPEDNIEKDHNFTDTTGSAEPSTTGTKKGTKKKLTPYEIEQKNREIDAENDRIAKRMSSLVDDKAIEQFTETQSLFMQFCRANINVIALIAKTDAAPDLKVARKFKVVNGKPQLKATASEAAYNRYMLLSKTDKKNDSATKEHFLESSVSVKYKMSAPAGLLGAVVKLPEALKCTPEEFTNSKLNIDREEITNSAHVVIVLDRDTFFTFGSMYCGGEMLESKAVADAMGTKQKLEFSYVEKRVTAADGTAAEPQLVSNISPMGRKVLFIKENTIPCKRVATEEVAIAGPATKEAIETYFTTALKKHKKEMEPWADKLVSEHSPLFEITRNNKDNDVETVKAKFFTEAMLGTGKFPVLYDWGVEKVENGVVVKNKIKAILPKYVHTDSVDAKTKQKKVVLTLGDKTFDLRTLSQEGYKAVDSLAKDGIDEKTILEIFTTAEAEKKAIARANAKQKEGSVRAKQRFKVRGQDVAKLVFGSMTSSKTASILNIDAEEAKNSLREAVIEETLM